MANLAILGDKTTIIQAFLIPWCQVVFLGLGLVFLGFGLGLGLGSLLLLYVYLFYEKSHSVLLSNLTVCNECNL